MKTALKIISIILGSILIIILGFITYYFLATKEFSLDESKLVNLQQTINFYDVNGNFLYKEGENNLVTNIKDIPKSVQNAFIAIEDKRFYSHHGVDYRGLSRAMLTNIKSLSFKEGGSTISQQLIKNTHLNSKKTFKRKLAEFKLAKQLEKKFTKEQILEKYLNTIYFGDNCFGITSASKHYFDKSPCQLTINDGALLAGIIKAPSNYSPFKDLTKCQKRKDLVLSEMFAQGYINEAEFKENYGKNIETKEQTINSKSYDLKDIIKQELNDVIKNNPYVTGNLNVYTTQNIELQSILEQEINENQTNCDKTSVIIDKTGKISAYLSTCGNIRRQVGSTIKPLLVYAPAIEKNIVYSCSPILDEKTNFNGYSPSNYNDKYYGYVSVKQSLAKSLNCCAVKLLNYTGITQAKSYLQKTDVPLSENDNSLCLALGATESGANLIELSSAYDVFLNKGNYIKPYCITRVESQKNGVIYERKNYYINVFSEETTHILNDMLEYTVSDGTAKKLSFSNIPLCSKTGTVGNSNGNSDAYNISYNSDLILGVWFGNKDNALLDNSISGGTLPTILASKIWENVYKEKAPPLSYNKSSLVCEKAIDKIEYEQNNSVFLADEITPQRYTIKGLFKNSFLPKTSKRFTNPKIDFAQLKLVESGIKIEFDLLDIYEVLIYRQDKKGKSLIYDSKNKEKNYYIDTDIWGETEYLYSIVPYIANENTIKGQEYFLQKIKTPRINLDEWWLDELN